jgi:hypothetical protein
MWWGSGISWIFPVIGMVICIALMVAMAFVCMSKGCGCMKRRERH